MTQRIIIVTHDFYVGTSLEEELRQKFGNTVSVVALYRVYNVPKKFHASDIVLSDGTCKDHDGSRSYPVVFDPSPLTQESNATLISFGRSEIDRPRRSLLDRLLHRPEPNTVPHIPEGDDMHEKILDEVRQHLV